MIISDKGRSGAAKGAFASTIGAFWRVARQLGRPVTQKAGDSAHLSSIATTLLNHKGYIVLIQQLKDETFGPAFITPLSTVRLSKEKKQQNANFGEKLFTEWKFCGRDVAVVS